MTPSPEQRRLSATQIEAFYHDAFVRDQTRDFVELRDPHLAGTLVDVGGGCGFFARQLQTLTGCNVRVLDLDETSIAQCRAAGVDAEVADALSPRIRGDEAVACFNLILHHLVSGSERDTVALQHSALAAWHGRVPAVFVNEYIYESMVRNLSGWLIYQITKSRLLSAVGRTLARAIPAFRANTFGVGVRFRSNSEWQALFADAGYRVARHRLGEPEPVSAPLRLLMIRRIRRDSFWLVPQAPSGQDRAV